MACLVFLPRKRHGFLRDGLGLHQLARADSRIYPFDRNKELDVNLSTG